jgi:hypothetical protein
LPIPGDDGGASRDLPVPGGGVGALFFHKVRTITKVMVLRPL